MRHILGWVAILVLAGIVSAQQPCIETVPGENKPAPVSPEVKKAADGGDADAEYQVAVAYEFGCGVAASASEAAKWMRRSADHGDALAQENLGVMYHLGNGVPKDTAEALKWYRAAAKQGNSAAMYNLGIAYFNGPTTGEAVGENQLFAAVWLTLAREFGNAQAASALSHTEANSSDVAFAIGRMYLGGAEIPANVERGVRWCKEAATVGANLLLGVMYYDGKGVARDDAEALEYFRAAAAHGSAEGNYRAAKMYEAGRGVPQDIREAAKRYEIVANQGHPEGMLALARINETGTTGKTDLAKAYRWALLARLWAEQNSNEALLKQSNQELASISAKLDPKQIAKTEKSVHTVRASGIQRH